MLVYCWTLYSVPLIHVSVFVPIPYGFDYCSFVVLSKVQECYASCFFFYLRVALSILDLLWFHIHFRIICSASVKNVMGDLIGIALHLQVTLGSMTISIILIFKGSILKFKTSFYSLAHLTMEELVYLTKLYCKFRILKFKNVF